ncbi:MAG TPA: hypothetical protein HPQ04_12370 [Rhodospirillaceae bacterium]|nr:hypothetical protein [Rhodospirillaceae bacterium]
MSVLFKALARAAKSRGARGGDQTGGGFEAAGAGRSRRRRLQIVALSVIALALVVFLGGLFLFGDELYSAFDELTSDQVAHTGPSPVIPKSPLAGPQMAQPLVPPVVTPSAEPAAGAPATPPAADAPVAAAPSGETPSTPAVPSVPPTAEAPPPAPTVPAPGSPPAQVAPPVAPPVVAANPPAVPPPPPAVPPSPPAAGVAQLPPAAEGLSKGGPVKPIPLKPTEAKPEEDLPAILARIRREKATPAISEAVKVDRRTASADLTGADGASVVDVEVTASPKQEDAAQAYDLLLHGEYEGALDLYRKALKTSPGSVQLLLGKATAEHKLRRTIDARDTYRKALAVDPENREALTNMTAIVAEQAPDQALQDLRGLQKNYPAFSPIAAQIASIEAGRNNLAGAITTLGTAVALSPENGLYRLNMAIMQDRAGMAAEAAASYQAAIDLLGTSGAMPVPLEQIRKRMRFLQGR